MFARLVVKAGREDMNAEIFKTSLYKNKDINGKFYDISRAKLKRNRPSKQPLIILNRNLPS